VPETLDYFGEGVQSDVGVRPNINHARLRMQGAQSKVGKVLLNCAILPPTLALLSTKCTLNPELPAEEMRICLRSRPL